MVRFEVCDARTGELVMKTIKVSPDVATQIASDLLLAAAKARSSSPTASSVKRRSALSSR